MAVHRSNKSKKPTVNNLNEIAKTKKVIKKQIDNIKTDPLYMLPVLKMMMDKDNPDNYIIQQKISDSIVESLKKDRAFMKALKTKILEDISKLTTAIFDKSFNGIQEEITYVIFKMMTEAVNKHKDEKIKEIDEIFDEYFKKLTGIINTKLKEVEDSTLRMHNKAEDIIKKKKSEAENETTTSLSVPTKNVKDLRKYLKFLQMMDDQFHK